MTTTMNLEMTCLDSQFEVDEKSIYDTFKDDVELRLQSAIANKHYDEKSIYDTFKDDVELRLQSAIANKHYDEKSIYDTFKDDLEVMWYLREAFVNKLSNEKIK